MTKSKLLKCVTCGAAARKKYCSHGCYLKTRLDNRPQILCGYCSKTVIKAPKDIKRSAVQFCDRVCCAKYMAEGNHHHYNPDRHYNCLTCGVYVKRANSKYCSVKCRDITNRGESHSKYNKTEVACSECSKPHLRNPSITHATNFCSKNCQNSYHSRRISGEDNPRFKDGIWKGVKQVKLIYGNGFTLKLRKKIRLRDNNTCQVCFMDGREHKMNMHVHHADYNKTNNEESNLICVCRYCHGKIHGNEELWLEIIYQKLSALTA